MKNLLKAKQDSVFSAAFVIMVTYGISFLLGLFKTWLLVHHFYSFPNLLDTYYAASIIPDAMFQIIVTGSLSAAFIPVFSKSLSNDRSKAWTMTASLLNIILSFLLIISIIIFIFAPILTRLVSPGFNSTQLSLETQLLRLMLISQLFFAISGFLTATLQTHRHFLIPALAPMLYNLAIIIFTFFLSSSIGIFAPVLGMIFGSMVHFLIQYPMAHRLGFRFSAHFNFNLPGVKEVLRLFPPRIFTMSVDQLEQFSATIISSMLISGSLTLFNLAKTLSLLPVTLLGVSIGQASLPLLSNFSNTNKLARFQKSLIDSLLQLAFLITPISILFIVLRLQVVRLSFGAPTLPWSATILTGQTLAILSLSAVFSSGIQLLVRGFYALHNTKTPLWTGLAAAILNVVLSCFFALYYHLGIIGIAIGWTAAAFFECLCLLLLLLKKLHFSFLGFIPSLLKILISGFSTSIALWLPMRLLDQFVFDTTRTLPLFFLTSISALIGFMVYLAMSYLFRVEELFSFLSLLRRLRPRL